MKLIRHIETLKPAHTLAIALLIALGGLAGGMILGGGGSRAAHDHEETAPTATAESADHAGEEGELHLDEAQIRAAGIRIEQAGPARIGTRLVLPGEIRFNEDRTAHVVPRVGGVVERVEARLGQQVKKGDVLAVLASPALSEQRSELAAARRRLELARTTHGREKTLWEARISPEQDYLQARQALQEAEIAVANARQKLAAIGAATEAGHGGGALGRYVLRAPFDGQVVERHLTMGEAVKEDSPVFVVSDLGSVWAEISVPAGALMRLRAGQKVVIRSTAFAAEASGTVAHVGALIGEQTRSAPARVVLPNPRGAWRPGLFVNVEVPDDGADVSLAVSADAVQELEGRQVVFVRNAAGFEARPVQPGRRDEWWVEILSGLEPDAAYAGAGSFVLKAELGKAAAEHSH